MPRQTNSNNKNTVTRSRSRNARTNQPAAARRVRFAAQEATVVGADGGLNCLWHDARQLHQELALDLQSKRSEQRGLEYQLNPKRAEYAGMYVGVIVRRSHTLRSRAVHSGSIDQRLQRLAHRHSATSRKMALEAAQRDQQDALKIYLEADALVVSSEDDNNSNSISSFACGMEDMKNDCSSRTASTIAAPLLSWTFEDSTHQATRMTLTAMSA